MIIIFKSQHYWVQWCVVIQVISRHDINPSWTNFVRKFHRVITWNFCFAHNRFYIICSAILRRLSKYNSLHNKGQSWHLTNDHSHMVEIIGIRNHAFHESIPGHKLNILWQNAVSDLYIFGHQWVNISSGLMLEHLTWPSKMINCDIWGFVKCRFLSSSCVSHFVIMEIIHKT